MSGQGRILQTRQERQTKKKMFEQIQEKSEQKVKT